MEPTYRLTIACPDRVGIVAKVSNFLATYNGWIVEASHHADVTAGWFFMRQEIKADSLPFDLNAFHIAFEPIAREFDMRWHISDSRVPARVVLLVSRESHCLADLLYRAHAGEFDGEIVGVISNHDTLRGMVAWHDIPYYHIPVDSNDKAPAFAEVERVLASLRADVVVLARYMQILPPALCQQYRERMINIHHSFLPSFAGARPYHKAHERGVKLIGATCHYVTEDLDEGPIIEQDVIRVSHSHAVDDLVRLGRDVEKAALARGLRYHLQDRVLVHENKTVVFS